MRTTRKSYPSGVDDVRCEFLLPYQTLMREDPPQRLHDMGETISAPVPLRPPAEPPEHECPRRHDDGPLPLSGGIRSRRPRQEDPQRRPQHVLQRPGEQDHEALDDHDHVTVEQVIRVLLQNADKARTLLTRVIPKLGPKRTPSPLGIEHVLDTALITAPDRRDRELFAKLDAVAGRVLNKV